MERPAQIRRCALLLLVVGYSRLSFAYQPTVCVGPGVMQDELARYPNACLFDANGSQDNLYNHMTDFLASGLGHQVDPRLPAAIAGVESLYGTLEGRCNYTTDNPWNLIGQLPSAHREVCR
jgi:hypothetical protein